jgi:hypothetical protein
MSFLPDELKTQTFPCPNCKQYISSEVSVCKFCSAQITSAAKEFAIKSELEEKKRINLSRHQNFLILGIALLIAGIFSIATPIIEINYSNNVNINCLTPIFVVAGIVIAVKSLIGYREEKRKI